jgi:hypothetical protein
MKIGQRQSAQSSVPWLSVCLPYDGMIATQEVVFDPSSNAKTLYSVMLSSTCQCIYSLVDIKVQD